MREFVNHILVKTQLEEGWKQNVAAGTLALGLLTGAPSANAQPTQPAIHQNIPSGGIVAKVIAGEAAGEGYNGMLAVANVIQNRGGNPVAVVKKPYQFSAYDDKALMDRNYPTVKKTADALASKIGSLKDITGGATHYLTTEVYQKKMAKKKSWVHNMVVTKVIGKHTFMKEK